VRGFGGSFLVALAVTQVFGFTVIDLGRVVWDRRHRAAPTSHSRSGCCAYPPPRLISPTASCGRRRGGLPPHAFYVDARSDRRSTRSSRPVVSLADDSWTAESNFVAAGIRFTDATAGAAVQVRWILATAPDTVALVPFESRYGVLKALNRPDLADR